MWVIILYKRVIIFFICVLLSFPYNVYAGVNNISAYSAVSMDSATGKVLYEKNSTQRLAIASTTKIMTCLLACEMGNMSDIVTITSEMLDKTEGSLIYLKVGDKISLEDLVKGALLASGNDAANAIAIHISKSIEAFSVLMNNKAKKLKMYNTCFVTPSGLDEGQHYSTAYDMALLASYAMKNDAFKNICKLQMAEITISNKTQKIYNHNKLLSYDNNYCGVKTGFTNKAGRCLVSAYDYNGSYIIIVTLNAPNDWDDHKKIKSYCVKKYNNYYGKDEYALDVVGGAKGKVKCFSRYQVTSCGRISKKIYYYPFIYAPIYKGTCIGRLDIYCGNVKIESVEIIASESVELWQTTK